MSGKIQFAIVAALEREIAQAVRGWERKFIDIHGYSQPYWQSGTSVVCCAGMGWNHAREYTQVVIETFAPEVITSVGFAGALVPDLAIGDLLVPAGVVSGRTGSTFRSWFGAGTLVTADAIAGRERKAELRRLYAADAVDMEAAAVAEVAAAYGTKFLGIKAVSDGCGDETEFLSPYVSPEGFRTGAFLAHVAVRPALWSSVRKLRVHSQSASDRLCRAIRLLVEDPFGFERRYSTAMAGSAALKGNR